MFKCILCGTSEYTEVHPKTRDNDDIKVVRCKACHHVQLDRLPSDDFYNDNQQLKRIYQSLDIEKLRDKSSYDTNRRLDFIKEHLDVGQSFLELGIGYGFLLEAAIQEGLNIDGLEIGKERREATEARIGREILPYDLSSDEFKSLGKTYDYIMFFQVLEHVLEPESFLEHVRQALNPGGQVIIEVPNYTDHMIKTSDAYAGFYYQEAHQSYYSFEILKNLLEKVGFSEIEEIYVQRYSMENFMNWYINKKPQIDKPAYLASPELYDLDQNYRSYLIQEKISDTLIVKAVK